MVYTDFHTCFLNLSLFSTDFLKMLPFYFFCSQSFVIRKYYSGNTFKISPDNKINLLKIYSFGAIELTIVPNSIITVPFLLTPHAFVIFY
jgi:hypothetical protein